MCEPRARLLVVDDSETNLDVLLGLLHDYDVRVALNGPTALEILSREVPDVVLLDVLMPGMDGFEVCRRIKADPRWRQVPVLFITAMSDEASLVAAFDAGASDYVTKPVRPRELLARVRIQVEYRRAMEHLRRTAVTDELTGLYNRRAFFEQAARLFSDATREGGALAALMIDLDHFKAINDRFGHGVGDALLRRVGSCLQRSVPPGDLLGRIGGEEFAIIAPALDQVAAVALAEQVREGLGTVRWRAADGGGAEGSAGAAPLTASVGVACLDEGVASLDDLLRLADDRLYLAKRAGRNRVCHGRRAPGDAVGNGA